jgi:outer membrane protein assembly factor BamB
MSWNLRRVVLTLGPVTLFCTAAFILMADVGMARPPVQVVQPVQKGPGGPATQPQPPSDPTEFLHAIELPRNPDAARMLEAAKDYVDAEDWVVACKTLQKLLESEENFFTKEPRKGADGKDTISWVSIKVEAERRVAKLPKDGMAFYKLTYGPVAEQLLKEAKESSDVEKLTLIHRLYLHTDAGGEATNLLATYHLDRGNYTAAALCYKKLLNREGSEKLSSNTHFRAAYAFQNVGDKANEKDCWEKLGKFPDGVYINKERRSLTELQEYIAKHGRAKNDFVNFDTNMVNGNVSRSGQGVGDTPFLESIWKQPLTRTGESAQWMKQVEATLKERGQPLLPAMQPVTATVLHNDQKLSLVIFRSHWGIHAVDMKTGKLKWETPSMWSIDKMVRDTKKLGTINSWVGAHLQTRPSILVENSTVGTLSTDGAFVYMIEDVGVPPGQTYQNYYGQVPNQPNYGNEEINNAVNSSKLLAFEMSTGKLKWEVGGATKKDEKPELADSYFLGAPMPLGGKLYVLTEKQQDLRLACLDPMTGKLLNVQTLATARDKMNVDTWRRVQATHLAYGEGILVCPTNSGAILGVDLLSNQLVWAYPYRDKGDSDQPTDVWDPRFDRKGRGQPPPGFVPGPDGRWYNPDINTKWKVSPPVIVDGKVVFTAPDANKIHCISLSDGGHVWSKQRAADDLYLAGVFSGKAVVVGKGYIKAYSLAKGEEVWNLPTGLPSGYGTASNDIYFLPLKEAGPNKDPEICSIDIKNGKVLAHTKSRKKEIPGNLLFYEGDVLSQTATEMAAYPQLSVHLARIDELIKINPNNPEALYKRGQLRLDKGDLGGAIEDLHRALENKPDKDTLPLAREKLYESLTEYVQRDFDKAEGYLKEYEELCNVPIDASDSDSTKTQKQAEQRRRRGTFLCLVAKGKEAQGKLVEAFERYRQYGDEAAGQELISVVDEPTVKATPEVWSGGRIAAMVAKATPENRKPLEDLLNKRWADVKKTEDINEIRKYDRVFGTLLGDGKEARLELANRLMEDSSPLAILEAEQHLTMLRARNEDPSMAGRAVEALARLNTRKGLLEDASYYYRLLRDDYAKVTVRDGKTGAELFNDMATDKRLLPHLDVPGNHGITGKNIKVDEQRGNYQYNQQTYEFGQVGEPLPFFQKHRLSLQFNYHQLKISDRVTGEEKTKRLTQTNFQNMIYGNGQPNMPKFCYMNVGHLVVLPVAHMVFGIDPIRGEVLWERNLYGDKPVDPRFGAFPQPQQYIVDPKDGSLQVIYQDGWVQRLGGAGSLESSVLVLHTRDGLLAIDPITNKTLWTRSSVNSRSHVSNDDQYVYVVEMNADGQAASTRVLRAYDGVSVNAPDFAALYQKRVRQVGRNMLLSDTDAKGQMTFRLYDVLAGKDLWSTTYAANSRVMQSEDANFGGVVGTRRRGARHRHPQRQGSDERQARPEVSGQGVGGESAVRRAVVLRRVQHADRPGHESVGRRPVKPLSGDRPAGVADQRRVVRLRFPDGQDEVAQSAEQSDDRARSLRRHADRAGHVALQSVGELGRPAAGPAGGRPGSHQQGERQVRLQVERQSAGELATVPRPETRSEEGDHRVD